MCGLNQVEVLVATFMKPKIMKALSSRYPIYRLASNAVSQVFTILCLHFVFACVLIGPRSLVESNNLYEAVALSNLFEFYFFLLASVKLNSRVRFIEKMFDEGDLRLRLRKFGMDLNSGMMLSG